MNFLIFKKFFQIHLTLFAFLLMLTQPLWAHDGHATAPEKQQHKETPEATEKKQEQDNTSGKSPGGKVIKKFKKQMNKISENISDSVERDKKTLKKKFDKLAD